MAPLSPLVRPMFYRLLDIVPHMASCNLKKHPGVLFHTLYVTITKS